MLRCIALGACRLYWFPLPFEKQPSQVTPSIAVKHSAMMIGFATLNCVKSKRVSGRNLKNFKSILERNKMLVFRKTKYYKLIFDPRDDNPMIYLKHVNGLRNSRTC